MRFTNKMYHCNVSDQGKICISTLSEWKEGTTMTEVLPLIFALFEYMWILLLSIEISSITTPSLNIYIVKRQLFFLPK